MLRTSLSLAAVVVAGSVAWLACSGSSGTVGPSTPDDAGTSGPGTLDDSGGGTTGGDSGPSGQGVPDAGPGAVAITYGTCPAFTKCGGDITGNWKLTGGCLSSDTFTAFKKQCPGLKESNVQIQASGTIDATATQLNRQTTIAVIANLEVPKSCSPVPSCALIESGLKTPVFGVAFDNATCTENGALCECLVSTTYHDNENSTYTTTPDGTLTTPPTGTQPTRTFDYCVAASKLTFTETTSTQPLKLFVTVAK
jgi:hypothetical protein